MRDSGVNWKEVWRRSFGIHTAGIKGRYLFTAEVLSRPWNAESHCALPRDGAQLVVSYDGMKAEDKRAMFLLSVAAARKTGWTVEQPKRWALVSR